MRRATAVSSSTTRRVRRRQRRRRVRPAVSPWIWRVAAICTLLLFFFLIWSLEELSEGNLSATFSEEQAEGPNKVASLSHNLRFSNKNYWFRRRKPKSLLHTKRDTPVLIFTAMRPAYLRRCLEAIFRRHPRSRSDQHASPASLFASPIIISQDGDYFQGDNVIEEFTKKFEKVGVPVIHLRHIPKPPTNKTTDGYYRLSDHYGWALDQVFSGKAYEKYYESRSRRIVDQENQESAGTAFPSPSRVIILEEDLEVATDFFSYMQATFPLLDDPNTNLWIVSAFNDNGENGTVKDPSRILRSDFFPGLGWIMTSKIWKEINSDDSSGWPLAFWDDWLRQEKQRKGRQVLRPEISRTYHYGAKGGASKNQFGGLLSKVQLNTEYVDFVAHQSEYQSLLQKDQYAKDYWHLVVASATLVDTVQKARELLPRENVRIEYMDVLTDFPQLAKEFQIMKDEKDGIPRTAYQGIVETRPEGENFLFLTPPLQQMELTWGT